MTTSPTPQPPLSAVSPVSPASPSLVTRRTVIASTAAVAALALAGPRGFVPAVQAQGGGFTLPPLPYAKDALAPHITAETLDFHYGKHHQGYLTNLNKMLAGKPEADKTLEEVIAGAGEGAVFNNAAQVWNHTFYWSSMRPAGGAGPSGRLLELLNRDFGSVDAFKQQFKEAATSQFGSGWAWLVLEGDKLKVTKTGNADLPSKHGQKALLTCDVWEHAYYIDFRNARATYVDAFLTHLVNWDFAAQNLG